MDESSSKHAKEKQSGPLPISEASPVVRPPPVVEVVDMEVLEDPLRLEKVRSINVPSAMTRTQVVVSKCDLDDYSKVVSEDVSHLMVRSLMRVSIFLDLASLFSSSIFLTAFVYFKLLSLNEAIVVSQRCLAWKESLMHVKAQLVKLESCKKYLNHIVAELTKEKREVVVELEKLRAELAVRDDDMKVAMEAKDKVVTDLQHLVGQIEGAKAAAVSKYRASKDFDDNNTRYFLSGLETFRKQVGERFPDLYFSVFQLYDDDDSVVEGVDGAQTDDQVDDASSK